MPRVETVPVWRMVLHRLFYKFMWGDVPASEETNAEQEPEHWGIVPGVPRAASRNPLSQIRYLARCLATIHRTCVYRAKLRADQLVPDIDPQWIGPEMRTILDAANEEAHALGADSVQSSHLLLGLLREFPRAGKGMLATLRVDAQRVRRAIAILDRMGQGDPSGELGIHRTPDVRRVLLRAVQEAEAVGATHLTPEHLLLGLVQERNGGAAYILEEFAVNLETVEDEVRTHLLELRLGTPFYPHVFFDTLEDVSLDRE